MSAMAVFMIVSNVRNARPSAPAGAGPYNRWAGGAGVKQHKMFCIFGDIEPPNPAACDHEYYEGHENIIPIDIENIYLHDD